MAKKKRTRELLYFDNHDDQEAKDLQYGGQKDACKRRAKKDSSYVDASIGGDWTPGED